MVMQPKIGIVAALEREMRPLVKRWKVTRRVKSAYRCYEKGSTLVVCAGVGADPARRAAEALAKLRPSLIVSAGLAGSLVPELQVSQIVVPAIVISSSTGERMPTHGGSGVLISTSGIAGPEAKRLLARHYAGQIVDMEAAAVLEVARDKGIPFIAIKAVSDNFDFSFPEMDSFVDGEGKFHTGKFVTHVAMRPTLWRSVRQLGANTARASAELCKVVKNLVEKGTLEQVDLSFLKAVTSESASIPNKKPFLERTGAIGK